MVTLILGALEAEVAEYREQLEGRQDEVWGLSTLSRGKLAGHPVVVAATGVGKSMAALVAQHLVDTEGPERLIFTGIAGALNADLAVGDMVVASDSLQHDLDARGAGFARGEVPFSGIRLIPADRGLAEAALSYPADGFRVVSGRILTGDLFLTRSFSDAYDYLVSELHGDAVEMEGASAGLVALINHLPFLLLRVLSDRADGSAEVDFKTFLPVASRRTLGVVEHVLRTLGARRS